jgi:hypothetical protein
MRTSTMRLPPSAVLRRRPLLMRSALVVIQGAGESSIRFSSPLIIDREQAAFAVDTIDAVIAGLINSAELRRSGIEDHSLITNKYSTLSKGYFYPRNILR